MTRSCVARQEPYVRGALSILPGTVPGRVRGLGHMVPTYFRRELRDRVLQRLLRLRTFGFLPPVVIFQLASVSTCVKFQPGRFSCSPLEDYRIARLRERRQRNATLHAGSQTQSVETGAPGPRIGWARCPERCAARGRI